MEGGGEGVRESDDRAGHKMDGDGWNRKDIQGRKQMMMMTTERQERRICRRDGREG